MRARERLDWVVIFAVSAAFIAGLLWLRRHTGFPTM